jgi:hypothetical protein
MRRPNLLDGGVVLGRLKARPGYGEGRVDEVGATAGLDPPCARRLLLSAGRDKRKAAGRTSEMCGTREMTMP